MLPIDAPPCSARSDRAGPCLRPRRGQTRHAPSRRTPAQGADSSRRAPSAFTPTRDAGSSGPRRAPFALGVVLALVLAGFTAGCEAGPTGPDLATGEDAMVQAVASHWHQLPGLESLNLATVETLAAGGATEPSAAGSPGARVLHAAVADLVEGLGVLASEWWDLGRGPGALSGGGRAGENEVGPALDEAWIALTGVVLGPEGAAAVVEGVAVALSAFSDAVVAAEASGGAGVGPGAAPGVSQSAAQGGGSGAAQAQAARRLLAARQARMEAQRRLAAARTALASGRTGAAVAEAAAAADALKGTLPEDRAAAFVASAKELLDRATGLAGRDPAPEIAALLDEAGDLCRAASAALDSGDPHEAVRLATRCARISRVVIARLSAGVPDDVLAERAAAAVEQAEALYERAVEAAGPSPSPTVAEALEEARSVLADAQGSLASGAWREAIRAAQASSAISRRILAGVAGGGDGLEDRAEAVVGEARALLAQVLEAAGPSPRPAVQHLLDKVTPLVTEAEAALQAGDFRVAIVKASRALPILQRVLPLLDG